MKTFLIISRSFLLRMKNVSHKICGEKPETHILSTFSSQNRAFYEITWKNIVEPCRSRDNIIPRMRIACWIPSATNSHS